MEKFVDEDGEILYKDKYYNTIIGIFNIIGLRSEKSNDGHKLYKVKCRYCGSIFDRMQIRHAKIPQKCAHIFNSWTNPRIGNIYWDMKSRCYNEKDKAYRFYGAKGIKVCQEWLDNPDSFEDWAFKNGYTDNLTIDRKDSSKDYCPENCRWIIKEDNCRYKSTTKMWEINEKLYTGTQLSILLQLGKSTFNKIVRENGPEKAIEFAKRRLADPTKKRKSHQTWLNVYKIDENKEMR